MKITDNRLNTADRELLKRMEDKVYLCKKKGKEVNTDFLNPYEVEIAIGFLNTFNDINYKVVGGIDQAERKVIMIFPEYIDFESCEVPLKALELTVSSKTAQLTHRELMGSVLGVGLKREKLGDIIINNNKAYVIMLKDAAEIADLFLEKISRYSVSSRFIELKEVEFIEEEHKVISAIVPSLRLDAVISSGFKESRSNAANLVKSKKVKVNYREIVNTSYILKADDLISCRGKGRIKVISIEGQTKKDRLKILIKKYNKW